NLSYNDFTFFTSTDPAYTAQFVTVATEASGIDKISLDGIPVPSTSFRALSSSINGKNYSVATLSVVGGLHHIITSNESQKGITIVSFGFGSVDSYGYTAGALLNPIR